MKTQKLPSIDITNNTIDGDISLKKNPLHLKAGEKLVKYTKILPKYTINTDGTVGDLVTPTDNPHKEDNFNYYYFEEKVVKIKLFPQTPAEVEKVVRVLLPIIKFYAGFNQLIKDKKKEIEKIIGRNLTPAEIEKHINNIGNTSASVLYDIEPRLEILKDIEDNFTNFIQSSIMKYKLSESDLVGLETEIKIFLETVIVGIPENDFKYIKFNFDDVFDIFQMIFTNNESISKQVLSFLGQEEIRALI